MKSKAKQSTKARTLEGLNEQAATTLHWAQTALKHDWQPAGSDHSNRPA